MRETMSGVPIPTIIQSKSNNIICEAYTNLPSELPSRFPKVNIETTFRLN